MYTKQKRNIFCTGGVCWNGWTGNKKIKNGELLRSCSIHISITGLGKTTQLHSGEHPSAPALEIVCTITNPSKFNTLLKMKTL